MPVELSLSVCNYDRTAALFDGRAPIEGCDVVAVANSPEESFHRAFKYQEFDVTEISMSSYLVTLSRNDAHYVAIPAFVSRLFRHSGIYVRTDRIKSPADLKGKTVGVPGIGALLHFMLIRNLKQNGVDPGLVRFVEVSFPQAADALKSGQIDAYPAQAPFTARILQSGAGYEVSNWLKSTPDGTITVVYATTRKWADDNKGTVKALQDGMMEAVEFSKANRPEMYAAIAKYTKLPPAVVSSLAPPNLEVDVSPQQIKFWVDLAKEQGAIKGNPDPTKVIYKP